MHRALAGFSLLFDHHTLDLIQVDSVDVECSTETPGAKDINSLGILYPGQRMDFILRPRQDPEYQPSIGVQLDQEYENNRYPNEDGFFADIEKAASSTPTRH